MLKLYLISQYENSGYDTYDSAVVCAETEEEARNTEVGNLYRWTTPEYVKVKLIGRADKSIPKGIVLSSFNAG